MRSSPLPNSTPNQIFREIINRAITEMVAIFSITEVDLLFEDEKR